MAWEAYFCRRHKLTCQAKVHVFDVGNQFFWFCSSNVFDFLVTGIVKLLRSTLQQKIKSILDCSYFGIICNKSMFMLVFTILTDGNCISGTNSTVHILLSLVDKFLKSSLNAQNSSNSSQNLSKQLASIEAIPMRFCATPRSMPNEIAASDTGLRCHNSFSTIVMKNFLKIRS